MLPLPVAYLANKEGEVIVTVEISGNPILSCGNRPLGIVHAMVPWFRIISNQSVSRSSGMQKL